MQTLTVNCHFATDHPTIVNSGEVDLVLPVVAQDFHSRPKSRCKCTHICRPSHDLRVPHSLLPPNLWPCSSIQCLGKQFFSRR
jgi:hypothetical protein